MGSMLSDLLGRIWIFQGLAEAQRGQLAALARVRLYKARETIVEKGDPARELFVLLRGRAKVLTRGAEGADAALNVMGPGQVFGEVALLDGQPRSATVVALEECEVAVIDQQAFRDFVVGSPAVALDLMGVLARRVRELTTRLEDRAFLDVPARLAKQLLWLAEHHGARTAAGAQIELRLSQQELGDLIGATRESVNKHLSEWTRGGVLKQGRDRIELLDLDALRAAAGASAQR
jgi:CRP-like cAMP-binding protein